MRVDDDILTATAPDDSTVLAAMRSAIRAPSVHNTQPWRWRFDGTRLDLYADADRLLATTDPMGRQLVISCGSVLDHARTAFADRGWHTETVRLPNPQRPERLATIGFCPWHEPGADIRLRARAIERRRTDRLPLHEPAGWTAVPNSLRELCAPHHVEVDVLTESARSQLATESRRLGRLRNLDLLYEAELDWWVGHSGKRDGVPRSALTSKEELARVGVGRAFPAVPHSPRRPDLVDRSQLVVLSTTTSSVAQWLQTGEALSAVLLHCTAKGLATGAMTHMTELPAGRELLANLTSCPGTPQITIRIGTAPQDDEPVPPTPRRPLTDILTLPAKR
ncbi:hypothetical protein HLB23_06805 [Nocardia uniformis]|uniref:NAD(P)H nitroreductase n=1 Tax=Nocardia uniformis TaxID=53432 RepID=A0A849C3N3_9NOCA|nr:hypothetical protein [Nocardia uniformis]NNH69579.1 hypothetical protein [Nocardia uniformis]